MNATIPLEHLGRPPTGEEHSEEHRYTAEDNLKPPLMSSKRTTETPEEGSKADEDNGKAKHESERARNCAPLTCLGPNLTRRST